MVHIDEIYLPLDNFDLNLDSPALRVNFMNIDDPAGTPTMSDKSEQFNMA